MYSKRHDQFSLSSLVQHLTFFVLLTHACHSVHTLHIQKSVISCATIFKSGSAKPFTHHLCDNSAYLSNMYKLHKCAIPQYQGSVTLLVLLLCGDIELNPGPPVPSLYPCGICELGVNWSHAAVCCDNCDVWYHKSCVSMNSQQYANIEGERWNCYACGSVNCSSFLYHVYNLNVSNSYEPLAGIPGDDSVYLKRVCSPAQHLNRLSPAARSYTWSRHFTAPHQLTMQPLL